MQTFVEIIAFTILVLIRLQVKIALFLFILSKFDLKENNSFILLKPFYEKCIR